MKKRKTKKKMLSPSAILQYFARTLFKNTQIQSNCGTTNLLKYLFIWCNDVLRLTLKLKMCNRQWFTVTVCTLCKANATHAYHVRIWISTGEGCHHLTEWLWFIRVDSSNQYMFRDSQFERNQKNREECKKFQFCVGIFIDWVDIMCDEYVQRLFTAKSMQNLKFCFVEIVDRDG